MSRGEELALKIIEKVVSEVLRPFPSLRRFVSKFYKKLLFVIWNIKNIKKHENKRTSEVKNLIKNKKNHYFFGYYDKCPWNSEQRYILFLKVPFAERMPKKDEEAEIGYIDLDNGNKLNVLTQTKAWNWQQGCMVQWLGINPSRLIIYNDYRSGKYVSIIYDIFQGFQKELPLPIYSISKDGKKALSLNFGRLHFTSPGYGYIAKGYSNINEDIPGNDGIWFMYIETSVYKLILPYNKIVNYSKKKEFNVSYHWINHIEFNPSGKRFVFLHRWRFKGRRYTRMLTADLNGDNLFCLSDYDMVSHFTWVDNDHILAWARQPKSGDKYFIFKDKSRKVDILGENILTEDGHPSYSPNNKWLITDTYPNEGRLRSLLLYNIMNKKLINLGAFFTSFKYYEPLRCDLHPRWSRDGKSICFDSTHEGKRSIYMIDLKDLVE